jgi:hypothetical protein
MSYCCPHTPSHATPIWNTSVFMGSAPPHQTGRAVFPHPAFLLSSHQCSHGDSQLSQYLFDTHSVHPWCASVTGHQNPGRRKHILPVNSVVQCPPRGAMPLQTLVSSRHILASPFLAGWPLPWNLRGRIRFTCIAAHECGCRGSGCTVTRYNRPVSYISNQQFIW